MREILFRGKRVDNGEWAFGYFWSNDVGNSFIRVTKENDEIVLKDYEVISETVGEYTGLTYKHGKKIFEGDIIECNVFGAMVTVEHRKYLVVSENGTYVGQWSIGEHKFSTYMHETWGRNVVGNKWDNSELLEVMR